MRQILDLPNALLKEAEVASILSVEVATLRRWRWAGRGVRWIKLGSAVRYDPADIAAFIEAGQSATVPHMEVAT